MSLNVHDGAENVFESNFRKIDFHRLTLFNPNMRRRQASVLKSDREVHDVIVDDVDSLPFVALVGLALNQTVDCLVCRFLGEIRHELYRDGVSQRVELLFWMIYLEAFQDESEALRAKLYGRIFSCNAIPSIQNCETLERESDRLIFILAEAIVILFENSFEPSRSFFDATFVVFVYQRVTSYLCGFPCSPITVHRLRGSLFPSRAHAEIEFHPFKSTFHPMNEEAPRSAPSLEHQLSPVSAASTCGTVPEPAPQRNVLTSSLSPVLSKEWRVFRLSTMRGRAMRWASGSHEAEKRFSSCARPILTTIVAGPAEVSAPAAAALAKRKAAPTGISIFIEKTRASVEGDVHMLQASPHHIPLALLV